MKLSKVLRLILIFSLLLPVTGCRKKAVEPSELSKLPAETHTGARTFGCLLNGKAYLPVRSFFGQPSYQCEYIYMNNGYYFSVTAGQEYFNPRSLTAIFLQTGDLQIKDGDILPLVDFGVLGKAFGSYNDYTTNGVIRYRTNAMVKGELKITFLDLAKQIVAGTFSFDAINEKGDKVEVRNGRFDMQYTN